MRIPVDLPIAHRLLNHGPVTLVTSAHAGARNVMAAAWAMPLDFDPPKVAVVIDANAWTRRLVEGSGEFALNVPCRAQAAQADDRVFGDGRWNFAEDDLRTLHYFGGSVFALTGATLDLAATFPD